MNEIERSSHSEMKGGEAMKRLMFMLYGVAAVLAVLYPALSEARLSGNHNETLVRDPR